MLIFNKKSTERVFFRNSPTTAYFFSEMQIDFGKSFSFRNVDRLLKCRQTSENPFSSEMYVDFGPKKKETNGKEVKRTVGSAIDI